MFYPFLKKLKVKLVCIIVPKNYNRRGVIIDGSCRTIPDDMSVLGFDDIDLAGEIIPRLSTIHVRKRTIGCLAVRRLIQLIQGIDIEYSKILVAPTLQVRESTAHKK
jgi:DNA-binding LacI/PurR family transcriptional regulator